MSGEGVSPIGDQAMLLGELELQIHRNNKILPFEISSQSTLEGGREGKETQQCDLGWTSELRPQIETAMNVGGTMKERKGCGGEGGFYHDPDPSDVCLIRDDSS